MPGAVLDVARSWLGEAESPLGSNHCALTEWYADTSGLAWTRRGNPWCAMFVSKCLSDAGLPTLYCYCPTWVNDFKTGAAGRWLGGGDPSPGDVVFFDWNHDGVADHVGLVEAVNRDGTVTTIEGNVGDAVRREIRSRSVILGFGRPNYTPGGLHMDDDVKARFDAIELRQQQTEQKAEHIEAMLGSAITVINAIKAKLDA